MRPSQVRGWVLPVRVLRWRSVVYAPEQTMAALTPAASGRAATPAAMIGFVSPRTGAPLWPEAGGDALVSAVGERVPIVRRVPRLLCSHHYSAAVGPPSQPHAPTQVHNR